MTPAIDVVNVTKVYRRFARQKQFATLKSALLSGSLIRDLQPDETFPALRGVSFQVPQGLHLRRHRPERIRQEHAAQVRRRHQRPTSGTITVDGRISALIELGAGFHPGDLRPREHLHQRHHAGPDQEARSQRRFDEIVEFAELQDFIDAPVKTYSSGHVHAARLRRRHPRRSRSAARRRSARRRRPGVHAQVPRQVRGVPAPQQDDPARHALARPGREVLRPGAVARQGPDESRRRARSASSRPTSSTSSRREEQELAKAESARLGGRRIGRRTSGDGGQAA